MNGKGTNTDLQWDTQQVMKPEVWFSSNETRGLVFNQEPNAWEMSNYIIVNRDGLRKKIKKRKKKKNTKKEKVQQIKENNSNNKNKLRHQ